MKDKLKTGLLILFRNTELIFWITALFGLILTNPAEQHFTLCPLNNLGFESCPGCGLGHSCAAALRGNFIQSLQMHPFGIFALLIIAHRIFTLMNDFLQNNNVKFSIYEYRT